MKPTGSPVDVLYGLQLCDGFLDEFHRAVAEGKVAATWVEAACPLKRYPVAVSISRPEIRE